MFPKRVLIVEDDAIISLEMAMLLQRNGYAVCATATNGKDALQNAAKQKPHLVILDIRLAGPTNGVSLGFLLREILPGVAILYISGAGEPYRSQAKQPQRARFLEKPFNPEDLLQHVRELLNEAQLNPPRRRLGSL